MCTAGTHLVTSTAHPLSKQMRKLPHLLRLSLRHQGLLGGVCTRRLHCVHHFCFQLLHQGADFV